MLCQVDLNTSEFIWHLDFLVTHINESLKRTQIGQRLQSPGLGPPPFDFLSELWFFWAKKFELPHALHHLCKCEKHLFFWRIVVFGKADDDAQASYFRYLKLG